MKNFITKSGIILGLSALLLSACTSGDLSFSINEVNLSTGEEDNILGDLVANKYKPEIAFAKDQKGKWVVTELSNQQQNKVSQEYLEVGQIIYGKERLFFSAKRDDGKWVIVEDFIEKGEEYDDIKYMVSNEKDQIFFIGQKGDKDVIVLNYEEEYEEKEILGFDISGKYDMQYVYTAYGEDGKWYVKDRVGYNSGPLAYATAPKYFSNNSFAAIAKAEDGVTWLSIIDGVPKSIAIDALGIGDFSLSEDKDLSLTIFKRSEKWALFYPSMEISQEYLEVKNINFHSDGEVVYTVVNRGDDNPFEIRKGRKEIILASSPTEINYQDFIDGRLVYTTKGKGRDWEVHIDDKIAGSYKRVSQLYVMNDKLIFAAETRNKGLSYIEIEID